MISWLHGARGIEPHDPHEAASGTFTPSASIGERTQSIGQSTQSLFCDLLLTPKFDSGFSQRDLLFFLMRLLKFVVSLLEHYVTLSYSASEDRGESGQS